MRHAIGLEKEKLDEVIYVRANKAIKRMAEQQAQEDNRDVSSHIRNLIIQQAINKANE